MPTVSNRLLCFSMSMSDDLIQRITSIDYEDYGSLHVKTVEWSDRDLILSLDVTADVEPDIPRGYSRRMSLCERQ
jgi:hypothetical protein